MNLQTDPMKLSSQRRIINSILNGADTQSVVDAARARLAQAQESAQQQQQLAVQAKLLRQMQRSQMRIPTVGAIPLPGSASTMPMPKGQLGDWIRQAIKLTPHTGMALAPGIRNMIMHESGGRPNAINNWDSNAAAGTPSIGLMQTIAPTFNAYALKGHRNIYNPVDNIIAGLRYALSRYGHGMVRAGGRHDAAGNYIGY